MYQQKLSQKATTSLVLSKQMQQSLKILQMTSAELNTYIATELENNPFLEAQDSFEEHSSEKVEDQVKALEDAGWQEESYLRYEKTGSNDNATKFNFENIDQGSVSLKEHLITQIGIEFTDPKEKLAALYITDLLDQNGYLSEDITQIAQSLKCSEKFLEDLIAKLQKLDPIGAYARNLKECLSLQIQEKGLFDKKYQSLLEHLDDIAKGELKKILKDCGITKDEFTSMLNQIKTLEPKPGRNFSLENVRTMIPDAYINFDDKGELVIALNSQNLPKVYVNTKYFQNIVSHSSNKETKKFCNEKLHHANWLIKSIHQRSETLVNVCKEISQNQFEFFEKGINYLKPMTLADIAGKISLHESTISRISNKVISTPLGVYEIKFFFSNALSSNYSENKFSTISVKQKLKELVDGEKAGSVLSDDELAAALQKQGISISRRTVAKYREQLKIAPSNIRKRKNAVGV